VAGHGGVHAAEGVVTVQSSFLFLTRVGSLVMKGLGYAVTDTASSN